MLVLVRMKVDVDVDVDVDVEVEVERRVEEKRGEERVGDTVGWDRRAGRVLKGVERARGHGPNLEAIVREVVWMGVV